MQAYASIYFFRAKQRKKWSIMSQMKEESTDFKCRNKVLQFVTREDTIHPEDLELVLFNLSSALMDFLLCIRK